VRVEPAGRVTVEDLGSRNGTSVEGVRLAPGEPRELDPGAVVQAGRTLLAVAAVAPTTSGPAVGRLLPAPEPLAPPLSRNETEGGSGGRGGSPAK
jgi:pSer/pThr/pTyr-binding forkhead associated (FHA) protein